MSGLRVGVAPKLNLFGGFRLAASERANLQKAWDDLRSVEQRISAKRAKRRPWRARPASKIARNRRLWRAKTKASPGSSTAAAGHDHLRDGRQNQLLRCLSRLSLTDYHLRAASVRRRGGHQNSS